MASMGVLIQHHFLGLEATSRLVPCAKLSHHILVGLCLPVVRGGEGTKPQYGERVSEHCPHVHPLSFFSPSSLFLFQLLYALKMRDNQTSVEGPFVTQSVIINQNHNNPRRYWFSCFLSIRVAFRESKPRVAGKKKKKKKANGEDEARYTPSSQSGLNPSAAVISDTADRVKAKGKN